MATSFTNKADWKSTFHISFRSVLIRSCVRHIYIRPFVLLYTAVIYPDKDFCKLLFAFMLIHTIIIVELWRAKSSSQCRNYQRYSSCRYNERQLIGVTVVRRVRPRAERWCDCAGHRRWKRAGRTLFSNWFGRASAAEWDFIGYPRRRWRRPCPCTLPSCSVLTLQA